MKLARKYHQALEASISRNFPDNGIISCMSHNTDGLYRYFDLSTFIRHFVRYFHLGLVGAFCVVCYVGDSTKI